MRATAPGVGMARPMAYTGTMLPPAAALLAILLLTAAPICSQTLVPRTVLVDGIERSALLHLPEQAQREPCPLVFVFHGHGGSSEGAARSFRLHEVWPTAIVAYPQGLPTATGRDPQGQRAGWQTTGDDHTNRDLRFVDTLLAQLQRELRVDPHRIHATGHSNGGGFVYLLASTRGVQFASFAPSAAGAAALRAEPTPPRPILHLAGRRDNVVPFANQQRTIDRLVTARNAGATEDWPEVPGVQRHPSSRGGDIAVLLHDGDHRFPAAGPAAIAAFFQQTPQANRWIPPLSRGAGLVQHVYASPLAGTEVGYHVYLPPDYGNDPARRYPVIYWLHGSGGGEPAPVAARFELAMRRGLCPPCLVVFPHGLANGMWCDSADGKNPVESVLIDEILPRIDRLFATDARRERRLLDGFSMGGYGAFRLAFRHRELFAAASSLAGGPLQQQFDHAPRAGEARRREVLAAVYGGDHEVFVRQSPWRLAEQHREALQQDLAAGVLRLRLVIGTEDETLPANRALHEHLQQLGLPHEYLELPRIRHEAPALLQALGPRMWEFYRLVFGG